ncbi:hypothetical protein FQA39_LY00322 [Lamprigera yunnana]|nr:hypothetical protein FQA39_LY00322 [Lamprigera yunnana]
MSGYDMLDYEYISEYEYDFKESHSTFYWEELLPTLLVYTVTLVLGLIGNTLIVFTTCIYRRMQSATNMLLASLASADLLLILFCIPVKVAKLFSYTWTMGSFLCKTVHYIQNLSTSCSVLTLTAISIERYYAIVHPMKAKYVCTNSQAKRIILLTWCLAILLAIPILCIQIQMEVGERFKAFWCIRDWENESLWRFHEVYMLILVLVAPTSIMTYTYSLICWEIWRVMEERNIMTSRIALSRNRIQQEKFTESIDLSDPTKSKRMGKSEKEDTRIVKQVIYMLVAVVALFAICWGPLLIDNVLMAYNILPKQRTGYFKYMGTAFHLMAYFNSCINPIIYGFMSKNFRDSFRSVLCCKRKTTSHDRNGTRVVSSFRNSSQTRTTSIR